MSRLFVIYVLAYLICFVPKNSLSQNTDVMVDLGVNAYQKNDFGKAHLLFKKAIKIDSSNLKLQFYYGLTLLKLHDYNYAKYYLKKVVQKDPSGRIFPEASYYMGILHKLDHEYDKAIKEFKKSKAHFIIDKKSYYYKKSSREINSSIYALRHQNDVADVQVFQAHGNVNGNNAEFAGFEQDGELYFTAVKEEKYAKIYKLNRNNEIQELDAIINHPLYHNANGAFSSNKQHFLFSRCDTIGHCKIMYTKKIKDKWIEPVEYNSEINIGAHNITEPHFSTINGINYLFFCSDKKGFGKLDIWYAEILDDMSIGKVVNAGKNVNSPDHDITPFFHEPSNQLFYSSTWQNGFGGFDIFSSHWNDSIFEPSLNLGQPINSSWNDTYFWINEFGKHGYFSSNREGSKYDSIKHCCPDLWEFKTRKPIVKKEVIDTSMSSKEIFKHKTGITLPLALYFHNDEPSPKSLDTVVSVAYPETYQKYISLKPEYIREFSAKNSKENRKLAIDQIEYFFNEYVDNGLEKLNRFTFQLNSLLNEYHSVEITIKGFASPLAKSNYNSNLSKRRISSLINYFQQTDNRKFQEFIDQKRLIIHAAPFGESNANQSTNDDVKNTKESIYSPKAALERRIEIQDVIFHE